MNDLKNPFGMRNGKIIMIEDISLQNRGLKCDCICPACRNPFEARLGEIRVHHFAHSGNGCDEEIAFLQGLYLLVREFILEHEVKLPELRVYWDHCDTPFTNENFFKRIHFSVRSHCMESIIVSPTKTIRFDGAEIATKAKQPKALILSYQSRQMALCIKPPPTVCKTFTVKPFEELASLELDASHISFGTMKKTEIQRVLGSRISSCRWMYSPKAITRIDSINEMNQLWFEEKQKKLEEMRRQQSIRQQEEHRRREKIQQIMSEQKNHFKQSLRDAKTENPNQISVQRQSSEDKLKRGHSEVENLFVQQDTPINDSFGQRWVRCEKCGAIKTDYDFAIYGGANKVNLGICKVCSRRKN